MKLKGLLVNVVKLQQKPVCHKLDVLQQVDVHNQNRKFKITEMTMQFSDKMLETVYGI